MAYPSKVKSIMGLIPEYNSVEKMLMDPRHDNPALTTALYEIDKETTDNLKYALLVLRKQNFDQIKTWIQACSGMLSISSKHELNDHCERIEQRYIQSLEGYGITEQEEQTILQQISTKMKTPLRIIGYAGYGFVQLYKFFKNKIQ